MAPPLISADAPPSDKRRVIDRALADAGHPDLEAMVRKARSLGGHAGSWPRLAKTVESLTGEYVHKATLARWFQHLDSGH